MAERGPPKRLDSWKEIGVYLQRDERTAMRWARDRGMPVHHVPGPGRGSAFAYADELDTWLNQQGAEPVAAADTNSGTAARPSRLWLYAAVLASAVALGSLALWLPRPASAGPPVRVSFAGNRLQAWDAKDLLAWKYDFPEPVSLRQRPDVPSLERLARVVDLDGDGRTEVLVVVDVDTPGATARSVRSVVHCFSQDGRLLWRYEPETTLSFAGRSFTRPWIIYDLVVSPVGKTRSIWLAVAHHLWWPSFVAKLDPTGRAQIQFVNPGSLHAINYVETAAGGYVLAGGFNNEFDGGILAVLKENQAPGISPHSTNTPYKCDGCPEGAPAFYFLFPRSELNRVQGNLGINAVFQIVVRLGAVEVSTDEVSPTERAIYEFTFDPELRLASINYSDSYWRLHEQLEGEGKVDHPAERCPERLRPLPVRMWHNGSWRTLRIPSQYFASSLP